MSGPSYLLKNPARRALWMLGALCLVGAGCVGADEEPPQRSLYAPGQPLTQRPGRRLSFAAPEQPSGVAWRARQGLTRHVYGADRRKVGQVRAVAHERGWIIEQRDRSGATQRGEPISAQVTRVTLDAREPARWIERVERGWALRQANLATSPSPGAESMQLGVLEVSHEAPFGQVWRWRVAQQELARAFIDLKHERVVLVRGQDDTLRWPSRLIHPAEALVMTLPEAVGDPLRYSALALAMRLVFEPASTPSSPAKPPSQAQPAEAPAQPAKPVQAKPDPSASSAPRAAGQGASP